MFSNLLGMPMRGQFIAERPGLPSAIRAPLSATYVALRGVWATGTAYPKNSLVIQAGRVYLAVADVPSRTTFTASDWQALGGGAVADLVSALTGGGQLSFTGSAASDTGGGQLAFAA